jgi:hypothetical protein
LVIGVRDRKKLIERGKEKVIKICSSFYKDKIFELWIEALSKKTRLVFFFFLQKSSRQAIRVSDVIELSNT